MGPLREVIQRFWGYSQLRPLQQEAMEAAVAGRDSLVVLPTGGGKSLCYQAPALLSDQLTVVVSPLIALMKDQVDRLLSRDIPAAFLNSTLDAKDRQRVMTGLTRRQYRMIFVAPERFTGEWFYQQLGSIDVGAFAIDEAHCISHWGHDFRGDYRQLGELKRRFPQASVNAFTATATPRVRADIIAQLGLQDPVVLVGDFFRPNLVYRAVRRKGDFDGVMRTVKRRLGQAGIIYCIRRADVDDLSGMLRAEGIKAVGYHAGMSDEERTEAQDAFAAGKTDLVVATVAFGMGIDRADIRYVIHAAMPKSIEHYQQETGRAGRDGQPAECILFYNGSDYKTWESILEKNESADFEDKLRMLGEMYRYCTGFGCRHRRLVSYFGQNWEKATCGACDICLDEHASMPEATVIAQKIMSCVLRTGERYGAAYVIEVLQGIESEQVLARNHEGLSTFGLLSDHPKQSLRAWIDQLVDQDLMRRDGEYRVLKVTAKGWQVLRSQAAAMLFEPETPTKRSRKRSRSPIEFPASGESLAPRSRSRSKAGSSSSFSSAGPLDERAAALFDTLRNLRREIAEEHNVPAFMVFSDKTLREMARSRPKSRAQMLEVPGIGTAKFEGYGERFLAAVREFGDG